MKDTLPPELEKRFDEADCYTWQGNNTYILDERKVKQFLAQALSEQRDQIIKQVEGMRLNSIHEYYGKSEIEAGFESAYNQALNDVIKLLKNQDD